MPDPRPKLVVITGPTASGKSSLAVDLALRFDGEIINADSMQVYRGMDVGTAKPSMEERRGIPHHMIDVVDPDDDFNASLYGELARPLIGEIWERKKACFLVGGTGLYIKTLLGGLLKCPPVDPGLRLELNNELEKKGSPFLHERLMKKDPEAGAQIHPNDRTRVVRALEIIGLTNRPLSSLITEHGFREKPFRSLKICLNLERDRLYARINERSLSMIDSGLLEETVRLLEEGCSRGSKAMRSLGYRHALEHLDGLFDLKETILRIQRDTRRYAKRQLTWFRADPEMKWVEPGQRELIEREIQEFYLTDQA
jgi:tRNA dimethylallyltransferase